MSSTKEGNPLIGNKYKSFPQLVAICINACLSSFFVGYSLVYVGALHPEDFKPIIMEQYHLNLGDSANSIRNTEAIVQGLIPIGGMIGALLTSPLFKRVSRK